MKIAGETPKSLYVNLFFISLFDVKKEKRGERERERRIKKLKNEEQNCETKVTKVGFETLKL